MNTARHKFIFLDGLRGVAAIAVVVGHYSNGIGTNITHNAYLAVDFFFMLSGFVIAYAYEERLRAGLSFRQFLKIRLIRLYPLYFLGITAPLGAIVFFILMRLPHDNIIKSLCIYIFHALLLPTPPSLLAFDNGGTFPWNVPAWSLSVEIGVNLLYAVVCLHLTTKRLIAISFAAAIALTCAELYYGSINIGWSRNTYIGGWLRALWSFPVGILLYRVFDTTPAIAKQPTFSLGLSLLIPLTMSLIFVVGSETERYLIFCPLLLFPAMIWAGARIQLHGLPAAIAAWLGQTSYAVYITHIPVKAFLLWAYLQLGLDKSAHVRLNTLLWTTIALIVAWLLDITYDTRVRKYLTQRFIRSSIVPA